MAKLSKRMRMLRGSIDSKKYYILSDAVNLLKKSSSVNFIESIDISVNLGIDTRKSDQFVRGSVFLPHGTGRFVRVIVFTQGANVELSRAAGVEGVGMEDLAELVKQGTINYDVVLASSDAMHVVSKLGSILGPKGLMPNPKIGTVVSGNIVDAINNVKLGQVSYRNDKNGVIHATIGKINFSFDQIHENLKAFIVALKGSKPINSRGVYFKKVILSSTMGIGLYISYDSIFN